MRKRLSATLLLLLCTLALAGCGQKGPLYLPEELKQAPPAQSTEDTEQKEN